jgi:hypothetical protein
LNFFAPSETIPVGAGGLGRHGEEGILMMKRVRSFARGSAVPSGGSRTPRNLLVLIGVLAIVGAVLVPLGSAKPPSADIKKYAACLQVVAADSTAAPDCGSGLDTALTLGEAASMRLTITNDLGSNQTLGSVNLDAPAGISIGTVNAPSVGTSNTSTATQIQLRNLSLPRGQSVTVDFNVTASACGPDKAWAVAAKQSNTFLGTGNDFNLAGSTGLKTDVACVIGRTELDANTQIEVAAEGGSFTFLGVAGFNSNSGTLPAGCANFKSIYVDSLGNPIPGGGVEITDTRTSAAGTLHFKLYINKTLIAAKYGSNSGQQFITFCAGAMMLNSDGSQKKCTDEGSTFGGWVGAAIDSDGKFTGGLTRAKCNAGDGRYYGILASFQFLNVKGSLKLGPTDPLITGWGSDDTYRWFEGTTGAWDYGMRG